MTRTGAKVARTMHTYMSLHTMAPSPASDRAVLQNNRQQYADNRSPGAKAGGNSGQQPLRQVHCVGHPYHRQPAPFPHGPLEQIVQHLQPSTRILCNAFCLPGDTKGTSLGWGACTKTSGRSFLTCCAALCFDVDHRHEDQIRRCCSRHRCKIVF